MPIKSVRTRKPNQSGQANKKEDLTELMMISKGERKAFIKFFRRVERGRARTIHPSE
jgi:hypothetical protein